MTKRITYDQSTITYWPSGETHSGDRVCERRQRRKESTYSDTSTGPESLDVAGGARSTEKSESDISSWHYAMG